MKSIKKINVTGAGKSASTDKTREALAKKGKNSVSGCPELMPV